jgi:hypothetical protein
MTKISQSERKRAQRERDRINGWVEVTVKVSQAQVPHIRAYAASLPPPEPPTDPRQLDMLNEIEARLNGAAQDE